jgi:hypothetical protein
MRQWTGESSRWQGKQKLLILAEQKHSDDMKLEIYGFKADVTISEKWYVGEIPGLHIVEQAKTLRILEDRLKGGVEDVLDAIKEKPSTYKKYVSESVFEKLGLKVRAYA